MSALLAPVSPSRSKTELPLHRFTVEEYHHLIKIGFLTENDRVELVDGWIVDKMPINPAHASALAALMRRLNRLLGDDFLLRDQLPITLPTSEPEPDLCVVRGPEAAYRRRHPGPADIGLVAEVADSSLEFDRTTKLAIYARARLPVYWIVDVVGEAVEVYTLPKAGKNPAYRKVDAYRLNANAPVVLFGQPVGDIPVRNLFPE